MTRKIEGILKDTKGVHARDHHQRLQPPHAHLRLVHRVLLRGPRPLGRAARARRFPSSEIQASLNRALRTQVPEAIAFAFAPPAIPGIGNAGGFSFWLQDRSGGSVEFLSDSLQKFLEAARKRPELAGVNSPFRAAVPQVYADVDRDKVLKQGVAVADVYQTLQAFLGGIYVNQFNRFGRQWRVFLQVGGGGPRRPGRHRPVLRPQRRRATCCRSRPS